MSNHGNPRRNADETLEPARKRDPSTHRILRLAASTSLALGVFAVALSLYLGRESIFREAAAAENSDIKVMTLNQSLGADLASLLAAPGNLNAALLDLLDDIAASDFPARAERQAELIARRLPDLVALQEVWDLSCADLGPSVPGQGCSDPSIADAFVDQLQVTLEALAALGADYEAIATVRNLDVTTATLTFNGTTVPLHGVPFQVNGVPALLTSSDRDVILARADTVVDPVPVSFPDDACLASADGCNYQATAPVALTTPNGLLEVDFRRGFVAVDATVRGKDYRLVDTHLEIEEPAPGNPLSRFFQAAQAAELIETLELTTPPGLTLVVAGDMNSSPEDTPYLNIVPPYMQFVAAGYTDIWTLRPGAVPGFSCCQDADLSNKRSMLSERIDMIFSQEPPAKVKKPRVVGDRTSDKTPPPGPRLWPSDHGGVVAGLKFTETYAAADVH